VDAFLESHAIAILCDTNELGAGVAERSGIEINLSISNNVGRLPAETELAPE
jgi:hypothetical protein